MNKLCKTKAEASGASLDGAELEALLKSVLYAGAREPNKQAALAADSAFIYLLRVASSRAQGSEASPEVCLSCYTDPRHHSLLLQLGPTLQLLLFCVPGGYVPSDSMVISTAIAAVLLL